MPRQAGVILLGTSGVIPPHNVEHMETACTMNEYKVIHPFAFRTHTHALGKLSRKYLGQDFVEVVSSMDFLRQGDWRSLSDFGDTGVFFWASGENHLMTLAHVVLNVSGRQYQTSTY